MESIDSLVTRLGRCVGGKLAEDVAVAVRELKAERDEAFQEATLAQRAEKAANKAAEEAITAVGMAAARVQAAEARITELEAQVASVEKLLDSVPQP